MFFLNKYLLEFAQPLQMSSFDKLYPPTKTILYIQKTQEKKKKIKINKYVFFFFFFFFFRCTFMFVANIDNRPNMCSKLDL